MSMDLCLLSVHWVLAVAQAAFWSFCTLIGSSTAIRSQLLYYFFFAILLVLLSNAIICAVVQHPVSRMLQEKQHLYNNGCLWLKQTRANVQNVLHCATVLAAACLPELNRQLREQGKKSHKKSCDSQPVTRMPDKVCVNRLGEEGSRPIMW